MLCKPAPAKRSLQEHFPGISKIKYEGPNSRNALAFKHYDAKAVVLGKVRCT